MQLRLNAGLAARFGADAFHMHRLQMLHFRRQRHAEALPDPVDDAALKRQDFARCRLAAGIDDDQGLLLPHGRAALNRPLEAAAVNQPGGRHLEKAAGQDVMGYVGAGRTAEDPGPDS